MVDNYSMITLTKQVIKNYGRRSVHTAEQCENEKKISPKNDLTTKQEVKFLLTTIILSYMFLKTPVDASTWISDG